MTTPFAKTSAVAPIAPPLTLAIAHATRPRLGETENGDAIVLRTSGHLTLFGVVDGVGHGPEAAAASRAACEKIQTMALTVGVRSIMEALQHVLAPTRGAAVTLCLFDGSRLEGAGVGNVTLRSLGTSVPALSSPGILGHRVARLRTFEARLAPSDRVAIFSDGVSSHVDLTRIRTMAASAACDAILRTASHPHDDATILIADACLA
jgi:negative regulator of sigma-B (phosphoserine phosphatase)